MVSEAVAELTLTSAASPASAHSETITATANVAGKSNPASNRTIVIRPFRTTSLHGAGAVAPAPVREDGDSNTPSVSVLPNQFASNKVATSKYTKWNFIAKNLYEQFRRAANIYFLIISILQVSTNLSPTNKYATIAPLFGVLLVTMIKEMIEDVQRHKADDRVNMSRAQVLRATTFAEVAWAEVCVGDIVRVHNKQSVPADLVVLSTSDEFGACYVETSGLDGENNLKIRQASHIAALSTRYGDLEASVEQIATLEGVLRCEEPNADLYSFRGSFQLDHQPEVAINILNTVWRGSIIQNTKWVLGLVVYSGQDSKLILNSSEAPSKRSHVDRLVNRAINIIFATLLILCSVSTILFALWSRSHQSAWYIYGGVSPSTVQTVTSLITFLILYNNLVPISLYVTLEVVKSVQGRFIQWDSQMYSAELDTPALARTSNLNEDLGQIEYIFSDKTGTLTCNQMRFKQASIGGIVYGSVRSTTSGANASNRFNSTGNQLQTPHPVSENVETLSDSSFHTSPIMPHDQKTPLPGHHSSTSNLFVANLNSGASTGWAKTVLSHRLLSSSASQVERNSPSSSLLSVKVASHRAMPSSSGIDSVVREHAAQSVESNFERRKHGATATASSIPTALPEAISTRYDFDETALMHELHTAPESEQALRIVDFLLVMGACHTAIPDRDETGAVQYQAASPDEETLVFAARRLGVEFVSRSKRYLKFLIFGESVEFELLNVNEFTSERKRMSVLVRHPSGAIVLYIKGADDAIFPRVRDADKSSVEQLREHLSDFGAEGLRTLVMGRKEVDAGFYAQWNDRYQKAANLLTDRDSRLSELADEVESSIELLGASAIEDRLQDGVPDTIRALSEAGIKIWMLTGDKLETAINIGVSCRLLLTSTELLRLDDETFYQTSVKIANYLHNYQSIFGKTSDNLALIVSGRALSHIIGDANLSRVFLQLCQSCKAVIACRLNPTQKATLVNMVKSTPSEPLTLAIGDGANDVSMLQTAHIGIGIVGAEGMQAVRAADYALAQFRFLQRLLLVHGRWNYKRVSLLILYSFYKNICVVLSLFYFGFSNGFSGTALFESWLSAAWNVAFTLFPIVILGFLDQDLRAATVLLNPRMYWSGHQSEFNMWKMVQWLSNAVLHSIIIYLVCIYALTGDVWAADGKSSGLVLTGTLINCVTMLTVNLKLTLHTSSWTSWNVGALSVSILIWFVFALVYATMIVGQEFDFFGIARRLLSLAIFWLLIFTVPMMACISDIAALYVKRTFYPSPQDIAQELDSEAAQSATCLHNELPTTATSKLILDQDGEFVPQFDAGVFESSVLASPPPSATESSMQLISEHRTQALHKHLDRLRAILSGNRFIEKKEVHAGVLHLSQEVSMHWLTLAFISDASSNLTPNDTQSLESEFHQQYVKKNLAFLRSAAVVIFVLMMLYSLVVTFNGESQLLARWIFTALALAVMLFIWTRLFRRYFSEFLFAMMIVGGIGKTLMITSNGVSGLALYAIVVFSILRSRFFTSLVAAIVDILFYDLYLGLQSSMTLEQLGFVDFLQLCLVAFAAFHGYQMEKSYRFDFLLQKDYVSERARTQKIVDNMLPTYVTKKMKANRGKNVLIANSDESVSIIFADVVGFGTLTMQYSPQVLVAILDAIYSAFDELCEKFHVQKLETVGKTYVACAGLQGTRRDHAVACAEMAEEMIAIMSTCVDLQGEPVQIRIGINTGRVITGVVGLKRPQFSLFGDSVNTSSRMQSTGVANRIHVSESTASYLRAEYALEPRQTTVKGKGVLTTYLLQGRTSNARRTRRHSLVHLEDDMVDEIQRFVQSLDLREADDDDSELDSVPMNKFTLALPATENDRGEIVDFEQLYSEDKRALIGNEVRVPIALAVVFFIVEAVFEWGSATAFAVSIFAVRFSWVALAVIFLAALSIDRFREHFSSHARVYTTVLFLAAVLATLVSRLSYLASFEQTFMRPMLSVIFLTSLACNSGIRFIDALVFNALAVLIFGVAGFGFALSDSRSTMLVLVFWVVTGAVINLVSSYGRELYQRREFVLKSRVFQEKEVADLFLYNMIPTTVAETLKAGRKSLAQTFDNVTILYSDLQGFTSYAASSTPENVVKLLSSLFTQFDLLTDTHSVYKIQTIGDAFVLVSGLPFCTPGQWNAADSAMACLQMAFDMIRVVEGVRTSEGGRVRMRIGVHTGKLIAGCIGTKSLRYDIWGSDCLCSNTLESSGRPSCVVLSAATHRLVHDKVECAPYEIVHVKGLGDVQSYCVAVTETARVEFRQFQSERGKASVSLSTH